MLDRFVRRIDTHGNLVLVNLAHGMQCLIEPDTHPSWSAAGTIAEAITVNVNGNAIELIGVRLNESKPFLPADPQIIRFAGFRIDLDVGMPAEIGGLWLPTVVFLFRENPYVGVQPINLGATGGSDAGTMWWTSGKGAVWIGAY